MQTVSGIGPFCVTSLASIHRTRDSLHLKCKFTETSVLCIFKTPTMACKFRTTRRRPINLIPASSAYLRQPVPARTRQRVFVPFLRPLTPEPPTCWRIVRAAAGRLIVLRSFVGQAAESRRLARFRDNLACWFAPRRAGRCGCPESPSGCRDSTSWEEPFAGSGSRPNRRNPSPPQSCLRRPGRRPPTRARSPRPAQPRSSIA
ncbi:hypothetical protein DFJ73DRAFT_830094 [Zopfochytrium polystomum]|nr:hypothetical protein DFJ73DRAFT_830094 [Zopfochytrium polystomum]